MPVDITAFQSVVQNKFTLLRSVPKRLQLALPFPDWTVTGPSTSMEEILLAVRPSLRVSVRWLCPQAPAAASEEEWLALWAGMDGLLVLAAAELQLEELRTGPQRRLVLDRRLAKRRLDGSAEELLPEDPVSHVWQLVTARPYAEGCFFLVLLSSWGTSPIRPEDLDLFLKVMDSFRLVG